ncbi:hypothetical protein HMI55_005306 [Coelomomyces lativittatus]|nr:hypothetical protein HMI55_005306 [Coelomomyces lativittatus]
MYRMEIQSNEPMHLFTQLKYIVDDFKNNHPQQPPIGVLTSENRDTWAHLRQLLMQHEKNRAHLECIESALFVASLDDTVSPATHDHFFHHHGRNRWFDKSINLVVLPDGQAGVNGEHSPCDAVVPGKIFNWVVQKVQETLSLNAVSSSTVPLNKTIKPLFWHIDSTVKKGIEEAQIHAYQLSQSVNVSLHQGEISWGWLKNMGGTPDALMQVAMQRAYHLDQNKWTATYESASIRKFKHGRTECIRSCTKEAQTWTHAMDDPKLPVVYFLHLLTFVLFYS